MTYNKLVRDRIPEIIKARGKNPVTKTLGQKSYLKALRQKLQEEVDEYLDAAEPGAQTEELADILEVIYALSSTANSTPEKIEKLRAEKARERGGFSQKIYLANVID
jgi:predicted house-cleaning noncanonical NTP pyrophosphatase (MazG superfamily)